jgi:hypothetical protein
MKGDSLLAVSRHQRSVQCCYHLRPLAGRSNNSLDGTGSDVASGEDALATGFSWQAIFGALHRRTGGVFHSVTSSAWARISASFDFAREGFLTSFHSF